MAQPAESKTRPEIALDQPCDEQGFPRIAEGKDQNAREVSVAQEIGHDGCTAGPDRNRQSGTGPKGDQDADGNARSGPEHRHPGWIVQESKTQLRRQEIGEANRDSQPDRADPPLRQVSSGGQLTSKPHSGVLLHVASPTANATVFLRVEVSEPNHSRLR